MSYTYSATIGRNYVSSFPHRSTFELTALSWETFIDRVAGEITKLAQKRQLEATNQGQPDAFFLQQHIGVGQYEGQREESAIITLVSEFKLTGTADLDRELASIGREYFQECVAITRGESELHFG